jgi:hypothetical protein
MSVLLHSILPQPHERPTRFDYVTDQLTHQTSSSIDVAFKHLGIKLEGTETSHLKLMCKTIRTSAGGLGNHGGRVSKHCSDG